jgi:hypothetical protein
MHYLRFSWFYRLLFQPWQVKRKRASDRGTLISCCIMYFKPILEYWKHASLTKTNQIACTTEGLNLLIASTFLFIDILFSITQLLIVFYYHHHYTPFCILLYILAVDIRMHKIHRHKETGDACTRCPGHTNLGHGIERIKSTNGHEHMRNMGTNSINIWTQWETDSKRQTHRNTSTEITHRFSFKFKQTMNHDNKGKQHGGFMLQVFTNLIMN